MPHQTQFTHNYIQCLKTIQQLKQLHVYFKLNLMLHGKWHEPLIEVDIIKNEAYSYMYLGLEAMCYISTEI